MNEQEWLECGSPNPMLIHLRPWRRHARKLRLFICAWLRHCWRMLNEPCRDLVGLVEDYCDGLVEKKKYEAAKRAVSKKARQELQESGEHGFADVGPGILQMLRLNHLPGWEGMAPQKTWFEGTEEQRKYWDKESQNATQYQLNLLRDIFGNPFRAVAIGPALRTPNVKTLAQAIYDKRRFTDMPILADALEEAGCTDADILIHCRQPGEHVRGCWLLDLLLGKK